MSYIDRNLLPGEQIIFRTKKHFIIFFLPVVVMLLSIPVFTYMHNNSILSKVEWAPSVIVVLLWVVEGLNYYFSDFAITNKRIMMREGFFFRHANELRINTISQVNVYQNLLGQVLDYGAVSINAFGAADAYTMIAHPYQFQKQVNQQLDRLSG